MDFIPALLVFIMLIGLLSFAVLCEISDKLSKIITQLYTLRNITKDAT